MRELFVKTDSSKEDENLIAAGVNTDDLENEDRKNKIKMVHEKHHQGVDRFWYLARKVIRDVKKGEVENCVRMCQKCQLTQLQ